MDMKLPAELRYEANEHVAVITLNRPQERNALDERLTLGLQIAVARIKASPALRVVFLTGNGPMFCAGGDPKGFQRMAAAAAEESSGNGADNQSNKNDESAVAFAKLLRELDELPVYVVALANGTAMGGGVGLLCVCDYVVIKHAASVALSEVKLGVIPATISPYVVGRVGAARARRLFMTGETLRAEQARDLGLVDEVVVTDADMRAAADRILAAAQSAAPGAAAAAKALVREVAAAPRGSDEILRYTAAELARVRLTDECAAGMKAVLAREKPPWAKAPLVYPA